MRVRGSGQTEAVDQPELSGRRRQQVVAADNLGDSLRVVVDDGRELVAVRAVVPPDDDVIGDLLLRSVVAVGEAELRGPGVDSQRRRAP